MAVVGTPITATAVGTAAVGSAVGILLAKTLSVVQEGRQDYRDAKEVLAGNKTLEQVLVERGSQRRREVELCIMEIQLNQYMTRADKEQLLVLRSLHDYEGSKRYLGSLQEKYLPAGFSVLSPGTLPTHPVSIARSYSSDPKNTLDNLPNLGKNLAAAEKADLGGTGAPSPSGWGPEDEQNARSNEARNPESLQRLNAKLTAEEIANGHAFDKHVLENGEFEALEIQTREQFKHHIENVIKNPSEVRYYRDRRVIYLQEQTKTVIIRNPNGEGTAFQPMEWSKYLLELPIKSTPY